MRPFKDREYEQTNVYKIKISSTFDFKQNVYAISKMNGA